MGNAPMSKDTAGGRSAQEQTLAGEIERTRARLGQTVGALAAKAGVKGRAQRRAAAVKGKLITPAPVQRSTGQAVVIVRGHRGKVAAAALAAAALLLTWPAVRRRRR